jgi:hypothetical protein
VDRVLVIDLEALLQLGGVTAAFNETKKDGASVRGRFHGDILHQTLKVSGFE